MIESGAAEVIASTHPGKGSYCDAMMIDGRTIRSGMFPLSFLRALSARFLVKVYVLGNEPRI